MSYKLSAQVIGAEELSRAFQQSPMRTARELSNAIGATAAKVEFVAKQKAPIEHGNLRGSITTDGPHVRGNNVEAVVGTNIDYAKHQEFGTGIYGKFKRPITPKNGGKFLVFTIGGKKIFARSVKGVKGKFYFKQAKEDGTRVFTEQMRKALNRIVAALATL